MSSAIPKAPASPAVLWRPRPADPSRGETRIDGECLASPVDLAERRLFCAIIEQAVRDLEEGITRHLERSATQRSYIRRLGRRRNDEIDAFESARDFLFGSESGFLALAVLLGIDPFAARHALKRRLRIPDPRSSPDPA